MMLCERVAPDAIKLHGRVVTVSPKIFRISSDIVVNEGSNVTLVCLATGKPEPSISWRHISPSGLKMRTERKNVIIQPQTHYAYHNENRKRHLRKRLIKAKPFESGQYLDIYGITRDQAGEYECSAENDVSVPDVKKVKVTVNCAFTSLIA
ncbi:neuronal growth regulator 1 [Grus japonensis]|uniref:Neuronal growth regulator 1 n=1 Tax=Grus japonensis TaxID=30415 RepID=A0ABC9X6J8_GRUJA